MARLGVGVGGVFNSQGFQLSKKTVHAQLFSFVTVARLGRSFATGGSCWLLFFFELGEGAVALPRFVIFCFLLGAKPWSLEDNTEAFVSFSPWLG